MIGTLIHAGQSLAAKFRAAAPTHGATLDDVTRLRNLVTEYSRAIEHDAKTGRVLREELVQRLRDAAALLDQILEAATQPADVEPAPAEEPQTPKARRKGLWAFCLPKF